MLSISLSNISKRIKKEFCTSICYSNALKEIMEHQSVLYSWKVTGCSNEKCFTFYFWQCFWLSEPLKHTCAHICGLNLLGWVDFSQWDTVCRHSPLNNISFDCTLPETIIHMSICVCVYVCVLWVVCVGCWGLLQHIYILFCGTFSRRCGWHEATQPPIRLRLQSFIMKTQKTDIVHVEMWCLHLLCLRSLCHHYDIPLKKCMCLLVSWKIWTKMSCTCSSESVIESWHSSKVISCTLIWCVSA